jgi:hypothetical protein
MAPLTAYSRVGTPFLMTRGRRCLTTTTVTIEVISGVRTTMAPKFPLRTFTLTKITVDRLAPTIMDTGMVVTQQIIIVMIMVIIMGMIMVQTAVMVMVLVEGKDVAMVVVVDQTLTQVQLTITLTSDHLVLIWTKWNQGNHLLVRSRQKMII